MSEEHCGGLVVCERVEVEVVIKVGGTGFGVELAGMRSVIDKRGGIGSWRGAGGDCLVNGRLLTWLFAPLFERRMHLCSSMGTG